jgi:hypothetical protein
MCVVANVVIIPSLRAEISERCLVVVSVASLGDHRQHSQVERCETPRLKDEALASVQRLLRGERR